MKERFFRNRTAVFTVAFVLLVGLVGVLAPVIAPNDPYETNILNKFASYSLQYPLGTDQLGRCVLSRMIRTGVMQYRDRNFVQFSRCVGMPERFILFRHLLPSITSDLVVLASLDVGWAIINISTLSFLGLGVQAPTPEWGAMLNEAKNVMTSNPVQMIAPGIAIVVLVCVFNLMGDALRDVLDPKEVQK